MMKGMKSRVFSVTAAVLLMVFLLTQFMGNAISVNASSAAMKVNEIYLPLAESGAETK